MNGILMKPENIILTIKSLKTETRRTSGLEYINTDKFINTNPDEWKLLGASKWVKYSWLFENNKTGERKELKPRYSPNQILYLKEPHYAYGYWGIRTNLHNDKTESVFQQRDGKIWFPDNKPISLLISHGREAGLIGWYLRSPMFMFAKDARYFIKIISVRPERLMDITKNQNDAIAEGMIFLGGAIDGEPWAAPSDKEQTPFKYPSAAYLYEWGLINGKNSHKLNPWIFAYAYQLTERQEM